MEMDCIFNKMSQLFLFIALCFVKLAKTLIMFNSPSESLLDLFLLVCYRHLLYFKTCAERENVVIAPARLSVSK